MRWLWRFFLPQRAIQAGFTRESTSINAAKVLTDPSPKQYLPFNQNPARETKASDAPDARNPNAFANLSDAAASQYKASWPTVSIYWDYENCPVSTDAHRHIRALLTFAQRYGSIRTLRAYMDTSLYKSQTRSMLHQAGVSVVDCPHEDKKEVVDRAMGADLIEFALHRPAPATVILISGDCDHSPAISKLSMNGYTTIILSPQGALSRMSHAQTTMLLSWPELKPAAGYPGESLTAPTTSRPINSDKSLTDSFFTRSAGHVDVTRQIHPSADQSCNSTRSQPFVPAKWQDNEQKQGSPRATSQGGETTEALGVFPKPKSKAVQERPALVNQDFKPLQQPLNSTGQGNGREDDPDILTKRSSPLAKQTLSASADPEDEPPRQTPVIANQSDDRLVDYIPPAQGAAQQAFVAAKLRNSVPSHFHPLMELMVQHLEEGLEGVPVSTLANLGKEVYRQAEVSRLKPYIELAEKGKILIFPDGRHFASNTLVSLHPRFARWKSTIETDSTVGESRKAPASEDIRGIVPALYTPLYDLVVQQLNEGNTEVAFSVLGTNLGTKVYAAAGASKLAAYIQMACEAGIVVYAERKDKSQKWIALHPRLSE